MIRTSTTANHATFDQHRGRVRTVQPRTNGARAQRLANLAAVQAICSRLRVIRKYSWSRAGSVAAALSAWLTGVAEGASRRRRRRRAERRALPPHELRPARPRHSRFSEVMGDSVGRVALFGIPLQQEWLARRHRRRRADVLPASDAPLYYYSFTDAYIAMQYRSLSPARAGAVRPDDHRVQSRRHVRRGPHPPRAADLPGRLHRHRRIHDPQGIRVGQGAPGPASLLDPALDSVLAVGGRDRAGRDHSQRHGRRRSPPIRRSRRTSTR